MPAPMYLQLESEIARAHRACHRACALADCLNLEGLERDLSAIRFELEEHQQALLAGRGRRSTFPRGRAYPSEAKRDDASSTP